MDKIGKFLYHPIFSLFYAKPCKRIFCGEKDFHIPAEVMRNGFIKLVFFYLFTPSNQHRGLDKTDLFVSKNSKRPWHIKPIGQGYFYLGLPDVAINIIPMLCSRL
jgi:hypothetical protein